MRKIRENEIWYDRKRTLFGLPLSFTKYTLTNDRLFIETGLLKTTYNEVRIYRMMDVSLTRTLLQRIFGVGTISVHSSDATMKDFQIQSVKNSQNVVELISNQIEKERMSHRVVAREIVDCDMEDDDEEN